MKINKQNNLRRRFCMFLTFVMLLTFIPAAGMPAAANIAGLEQSRIDEVREILDSIPYRDYALTVQDTPIGTAVIPITQVDNENTNAEGFRTLTHEGKTAFLLPEDGVVAFTFNVPVAGRYNLELTYMQYVGKTSSIERLVRINGRVPFREARYITMTKVYKDLFEQNEDGSPRFTRDIMDNDIRAPRVEAPEWQTIRASDSSGFIVAPFLFYLEAGENTISFEAVRESVYFANMQFVPPRRVITYEEYRASVTSHRGTAESLHIEAELPSRVSAISINPINDRTSAITSPQDASRIRLNAIGGTNWNRYGDWIRWEFTIPPGGAGLYHIVPRYKQSQYSGVYSSRRIRINGEVPFAEANNLRFNFSDSWQVRPLNNGETEFEFYLQEGLNVIELEVSLGDMAAILGRVEGIVMHLNQMYREIRMITGSTPDPNRDYGFERLIPHVLEGLRDRAIELREISEDLANILGGRGEHSVILDSVALQLERMAHNTDRIAPGMGRFNGNIGNLGMWLFERRLQPLELDWIRIHRIGDDLPRREANFFQGFAFEFMSFIMSFFADYHSVGLMEAIDGDAPQVAVWLETGRDQAQIVRQLAIDFTQTTGIQANIKLAAPGSLLPSILAGVGPDVALSRAGPDAINFAIRRAVQSLNDFEADPSRGIESFDTVRTWFHPSAFIPLTFHDNRNFIADPNDPFFNEGVREHRVYALPEQQMFPMMFYRKDVLVEMGVDIPRTWEDLFDSVPTLQKANLDIGIPPGLVPLQMFMFQNNVSLFRGDGIEINLEDNRALDAFQRMTQLYTLFRFPVVFDFPNRFRSGEMPIGLASYELYNQLTIFMPEIRGLWEFVPIPGTVRQFDPEYDVGKGFEELGGGYILDNRSPANVTCVLMTRNAYRRGNMDNAWAFMQWWVSARSQSGFGNEMVALMGEAAKQPTANLEALELQAWTTTDMRNLQAQFQFLQAAEEVPGSYIVGRYVNFAFLTVYNDGAHPIETILDLIVDINNELTRKRREFRMPVLERDRSGRIIRQVEELRATDD